MRSRTAAQHSDRRLSQHGLTGVPKIVLQARPGVVTFCVHDKGGLP
jgi:hypothetical protein